MSDDTKTNKQPAQSEQITIKQIVEQLIPSAIAAAVQATKQSQAPVQAARPANVAAPRCGDCGQEKTACGGKHVQMVVFPLRYPQHAEYFMGVQINGVKYLSNDENHKVTVPEEAAGSIKSIVQAFEQNEQDMAVGRKAIRHSGTVSPYGASTSPAQQAWR